MTPHRWRFCAAICDYSGEISAFNPAVDFGSDFQIDLLPDWYHEPRARYAHAAEEIGLGILGEYEVTSDSDLRLFPMWEASRAINDRCGYLPVAVWCARPCAFKVDLIIHYRIPAPDETGPSVIWSDVPAIQPLHDDWHGSLDRGDIDRAAAMFRNIERLPTNGTVRIALRFVRKALGESMWDVRIALMWMALEALFGVASRGEATFRLSTNIALFLSDEYDERQTIAKQAKELYGDRSAVVHGSRNAGIKPAELLESCGKVESLVRRSLTKILLGPELARFDTKQREAIFSELLFRKP